MRFVIVAASVIGACLFSSCSTVGLMVGDAPVSGHVNAVSLADIHEAIVAAKSSPNHPGKSSPYAIEVRNKDEIYLYTMPDGSRFDYIKRERHGWRFQSDGLVLKEYFPVSSH